MMQQFRGRVKALVVNVAYFLMKQSPALVFKSWVGINHPCRQAEVLVWKIASQSIVATAAITQSLISYILEDVLTILV